MKTIVILEPDRSLRDALRKAFNEAGYTAVASGNRTTVLEVLHRDPKGYALVVSNDEMFFKQLDRQATFDHLPKMSIGRSGHNDMKALVERVEKLLCMLE